jgi:hypothetical protein
MDETLFRWAMAFCEASGKRAVRFEGNSERLRDLATENALRLGAGHSFIVLMEGCYPVLVLDAIKVRHAGSFSVSLVGVPAIAVRSGAGGMVMTHHHHYHHQVWACQVQRARVSLDTTYL